MNGEAHAAVVRRVADSELRPAKTSATSWTELNDLCPADSCNPEPKTIFRASMEEVPWWRLAKAISMYLRLRM